MIRPPFLLYTRNTRKRILQPAFFKKFFSQFISGYSQRRPHRRQAARASKTGLEAPFIFSAR
jgi:hypothetical protein